VGLASPASADEDKTGPTSSVTADLSCVVGGNSFNIAIHAADPSGVTGVMVFVRGPDTQWGFSSGSGPITTTFGNGYGFFNFGAFQPSTGTIQDGTLVLSVATSGTRTSATGETRPVAAGAWTVEVDLEDAWHNDTFGSSVPVAYQVPSRDACPASKPTTPVATLSGSSVDVAWSSGNDGGVATSYMVVAQPGGQMSRVDGSTTTTSFDQLGCGTYTFTVTASNAYGTSAVSAGSSPISVDSAPAMRTPPIALVRDGGATVSWTSPKDGCSPVTSYTVTASPGGATQTVGGSFLSAIFTGLTNGTDYTFTVTATNGIGSTTSAPSLPMTPAGLPAAPGRPKVTVGRGRIVVAWRAPSGNGAHITHYVVTCGAKAKIVSGSKRSVRFAKLSKGTYRVWVAAENRIGDSLPSPVVTTRVK